MLSVITLLFEFAILALFKSTGTNDVGDFFASILILIHTVVVIASFNQNKRIKRYSKYLTIGFLIRLLFLTIDVLAYPDIILPNGHGDEDMFYDNAIYYAEYGITQRGYYCVVMGRLFRLIGNNRFFGQYISMLCSIIALVYLVYSLTNLDISDNSKKRIIKIVCILPNFAILSSLFMREAVISMFLTVSLYYFVRWAINKREIYYFVACGFVLPAARFHSGMIAVLVGYVIVRVIYDNKKNKITISFPNIVFSIIIGFLAVYIINRTGGLLTSKFNGVDSIEDIANTYDMGASSYARYVGNSNNPINFIIYSPLRVFFFLTSPVPWMWRGISDIIAFLFSSLYFFVVIWNVVKYLKKGEKKNKTILIALFVIALATTFVFAWGTSNAGTATRHRDKMVTIFALLWAISSDGLQASVIVPRERDRSKSV